MTDWPFSGTTPEEKRALAAQLLDAANEQEAIACPARWQSRVDHDHGGVLRHKDGSFCNHHPKREPL